MAIRVAPLDDNLDFPEAVEARRAEKVASRVGAEYWISDINSFTLGPTVRTTWETPDQTGVACHPSVRFFPQGFNGYQWWAAATPYFESNNQVENPCIYVSKDGTNWITPPGVTNPLAPSPDGGTNAYNSDTHLIQGPNGNLFIFYRDLSETLGSTEKIMLMESADGIAWSKPVKVYGTTITAQRLVSPAVWWDASAENWVMLGVDIVPAVRVIKRFTAKSPYGPWAYDQTVTLDLPWPANKAPWHLDAVQIGTQVLMAVQDTVSSGNGGDLYLCISKDGGRTFERARTPIATGNRYRSCVLPKVTERGLALDVWVGNVFGDWAINRGTAAVPAPPALNSGQMSALSALAGNTEMLLAKNRISPYIMGDDFNRSDTTAGLGTAPTGQAWRSSVNSLVIKGGRATAATDANSRELTDLSASDYEIQLDIYPSEATVGANQGWVCIRVVDGSNYIRVGRAGHTLEIQRITGAAATVLHTFGGVSRENSRVAVRAVGDQITVSSGNLTQTVTSDQGQASKTIGLQFTNTAVSADNLTVKTV